MKNLNTTGDNMNHAMNHLKNEKSPYLLQHKDNPVHWYPWNQEAFRKAKEQNKPIFLSIGYSTCHWCHVMEHESFENVEIAQILNDHFISIKVDREERPDIDNVYMKVVTSLTGSGGWPLTVFLTSDKKPFYGGTYFPPETKWGRPGLKEVLLSINDQWAKQPLEIIKSSDAITQSITRHLKDNQRSASLNIDILDSAYSRFYDSFDSKYGGFRGAPKFPSAHNLSFLLGYWKRTGEQAALQMVKKTLDAMSEGGIYDHLSGGFHRYATDQKWHVPHFEKMLYDQALLSKTYLQAYQATGNEKYAKTAREIFEYVLCEMTDSSGGFYSAEDADSYPPEALEKGESSQLRKKEGAFYLWEKQQVLEILGKQDGEIFSYYFGIKKNGNAQHDPHNEFDGKNILRVATTLDQTAGHFKKTTEEITEILQRSKKALRAIRSKRPKPHRDDKVLLDWNGLMISSLAFGSRVLNEPRYKEAAERATQFILNHLIRKDGRLLHRYRDHQAAILGTIEDYAFFIHGLIDLYEATFKIEYLLEAKRLSSEMIRLFEDEDYGGFFFVARDAEKLIFEDKEIYDGAIPSGNSMAALDLIRLWRYTLDSKWELPVKKLFNVFADKIQKAPDVHAQTLIALDFIFGPSKEVVVAEGAGGENISQIIDILYGEFIPNKIVIHRPFNRDSAESIISLNSFIEHQVAKEGKTTIYVCENYVCNFPITDLDNLKGLLK